MLKSILKQESGFSLIQVMIGIGLLGGLAVGVMQVSKNMNFVQSSAQATQEEIELSSGIRGILDIQDNCSVSLGGLNPNTSPVTFKKRDIDSLNSGKTFELFSKVKNHQTGQISRIKRYSSNDPAFKKFKNLEIKNIKLVMDNGSGFNYGPSQGYSDSGKLIVDIEKTLSATSKTSKRLTFNVIVNTKTDNNGVSTILSCQSKPEDNPCSALGLKFNESTGKCGFPKVTRKGSIQTSNSAGMWGSWGSNNFTYCPTDQVACGVITRVEGPQGGGDDTAMNAVRLVCCNSIEPLGAMNKQQISSLEGGWGDWGLEDMCPAGKNIIGYRLRIEPNQGGGGGNDDTALNDIELYCEGGGSVTSKKGSWGNYGAPAYCPTGQKVCGLKTRLEGGQGGGDDTSLNGVRLACCEVESI